MRCSRATPGASPLTRPAHPCCDASTVGHSLRVALARRSGVRFRPSRPRQFGSGREFRIVGILDALEREPFRGHEFCTAGADGEIAERIQFSKRHAACADLHARPHERAHHAVTKRVGADDRFKHAFPPAMPGELLQLANRGRPLARFAERAEIAEPEEGFGSIRHRAFVKGKWRACDIRSREGLRRRALIGQPIAVLPCERRKARVEVKRHLSHGEDAHVGIAVKRTAQPAQRGIRQGVPRHCPAALHAGERVPLSLGEIDMHNLAGRVHAGIRAPRNDRRRCISESRHEMECVLHDSLHRAEPGLFRPPRETRAVIGEIDADAGRGIRRPAHLVRRHPISVEALVSYHDFATNVPFGGSFYTVSEVRFTIVFSRCTETRKQEMQTPSSTPTSPTRLPHGTSHLAGLDGLRAIGVTLVVIYHLFPQFVPGGFIGVDIFFVVSGFLITTLLVREKNQTGRIDLVSFWKRRARRLLPALAACVSVTCLAAVIIGGDVLLHIREQIIGALTFSANWVLMLLGQSYTQRDALEIYRNFWSLGVEEQFYLLWPLIVLALLLLPRRFRAVAGLALAAISVTAAAVLSGSGASTTRIYYGTDTHAFGLMLGAALALLGQAKPWQIREAYSRRSSVFTRMLTPDLLQFAAIPALAGLGVIAAVVHDSDRAVYPGYLALASVLSTVVIAGCTCFASRLGSALDAPPLRYIGKRSYGIYLWHWPVITLAWALFPSMPRTGWPGAVLAVVSLAISLTAAEISYRYLETPIRRDGFRSRVRRAWDSVGPAGWRSRVRVSLCGALVVALASIGTAAMASTTTTEADEYIQQGEKDLQQSPAPTAKPAPSSAAPAPQNSQEPSATLTIPAAPQTQSPAAPAGDAPVIDGSNVTAIGDSVMVASSGALQRQLPGISIDAKVSRQMKEAPDLVAGMARSGTLRGTVVIGLGTNGPFSIATLERIRTAAGNRTIVFVNTFDNKDWMSVVNQRLADYAKDHQPQVRVADWCDHIRGRTDLLASDQTHPGRTGATIYATAVVHAISQQ